MTDNESSTITSVRPIIDEKRSVLIYTPQAERVYYIALHELPEGALLSKERFVGRKQIGQLVYALMKPTVVCEGRYVILPIA